MDDPSAPTTTAAEAAANPSATDIIINAKDKTSPSSPPTTTSSSSTLLATPATAAADKLSSSDQDIDDNASTAGSDIAIAVADEDQGDFLDDINAAPMHLHALSRIPGQARLIPRHNSDGKLSVGGESSIGGGGRRSRSTSRSRPASSTTGGGGGRRSANSSRSSSPLPTRHQNIDSSSAAAAAVVGGDASTAAGGGHSIHSIISHCSSLDGIYDPDVLLDRLGFIDLDPPLPHEIRCGPLAAPGTIDGKSNNSGGLTPVNERLCEETLEDCHAFNDLVMIDNLKQHITSSSTMSMPSVAHSSLSGMRSDMSVGSLSVGSYKTGHSRGGSVGAGGSLLGDGENSVLLGTLDEEGEEDGD